MKKSIKNHWFKVIITIIILSMVGVIYYQNQYRQNQRKQNKNKVEIISDSLLWREVEEPYSNNIVCNLEIFTTVISKEQKIIGETNVNINPMNLTFINLNTDTPSMIGNYGDKVSLIKADNGTTLYLIETTGLNNINVFTLFRDKNIMMMSKQYNLLGTPFGMMMIGHCFSGV